MDINDNQLVTEQPDAHGQAALLLAESILHSLIETNILAPRAAMAVVERACEVKVDVADASGESEQRMRASLTLLRTLMRSLEADVPG